MKHVITTGRKTIQTPDASRLRYQGFSLVELMVAMTIASIVMAAIFSVHAGLTRSYRTQNAAADVQQAVRATINFMAEDIMMAGLTNPQEDYPVDLGISEAGSWKISFNADRDMDGDITASEPSENITYELVDDPANNNYQIIQITDHLGTATLIDNVINSRPDIDIPLFKYYRENDTDTPTNNDLINGDDLFSSKYDYPDPMDDDDESERKEIRTVEISIIVEEPAGREGTIQRTYTTRVRRRNVDL